MVLDGKSSLEYPVNAGFPHLFYYILMTFLVMLCNIAVYADDTTFYSECDQASDLW